MAFERELRSRSTLDRRDFLKAGAGAAATLALAGCGSAAQSGGVGPVVRTPTYVAPRAAAGAIKSDLGDNPILPVAFETYPKDTYTSVPQPPANGGTVTSMQLTYGTLSSNNPFIQELSKRLGTQYKPTLISDSIYHQKVATQLASGDLPDIMWIQPDQTAPEAQAVVQGAFTDLGDALAGNAVKAYPNLASIAKPVWQQSSFDGAIYGVPQPYQCLNKVDVYRSDWAQKLGFSKPPANADEVMAMLTAFSKGKPAGSTETWGMASLSSLEISFVQSMFRSPNNWRLNKDGSFSYYIETDEWEQALQYLVKMWKAGVFNPDAVLNASIGSKITGLFMAGQTGYLKTSPTGWFQLGSTSGLDTLLKANPDAKADLLVTPGHDGGAPLNPQTGSWWGIAAIPQSVGKDKKRLDTLLRVLNYLQAPVGSTEAKFLYLGTEGRNYTLDASGNPVPNPDSDIAFEPANSDYGLTQSNLVLYWTGTHGRATQAEQYLAKQISNSIPDPTDGLYSPTWVNQNGALTDLSTGFQNDIITGRKPLSALKQWRAQWKKTGGTKAAGEFQKALENTQKKK